MLEDFNDLKNQLKLKDEDYNNLKTEFNKINEENKKINEKNDKTKENQKDTKNIFKKVVNKDKDENKGIKNRKGVRS